jgi:hypothetical protein
MKSLEDMTHSNKEGRLRAIEVVDPPTIWDEADGVKLVHEILESAVDLAIELRLEESKDDPIGIPIV